VTAVRLLLTAVCFVAAGVAARSVGHGEPVDLKVPFDVFPQALGEWSGSSQPFSAKIERKLGVTDYVSRFYRRDDDWVHLYAGYYASQKHGETIHSPKNCLPGSGWFIESKGAATLDLAPYAPFEVNSFVVQNGIDRQLVLYWYQQAGGRIVTNEYLGRVRLVLDGLTRNRTDVVLIRAMTPIETSVEASRQAAVDFLRVAYPQLMRFLPHEVPLR
jgi:EpsI family protein